MPYSHNPDASAVNFEEQSRNHGSVVCGARAWLLSGVTLLHVALSSPQTRQKNSLNTVELGPKEAVWIAIIQFSGEGEPIIIQVSPKHQMFSINKQILGRVVQFWVAFSSRVLSDTAVVFVNGSHESGVLLWSSLIAQTGSKLHPVWSTRVMEAWVCSNSQVSNLSQFKLKREFSLSSCKQCCI